jgi:hypothetical protein
MAKKLKDFVDDWSIDSKTASATHKDGLKFKYSTRSIETGKNLEISNLPKWYPTQKAQGMSSDMVDKKLEELQAEFVEIYKKIIVPERMLLAQGNSINR